MISARISEQGSIFATNDEPRPMPVGCRQAAPRVASTERAYPTLLTFISGALAGGNYDSYSNKDFEDAYEIDNHIFLGADIGSGVVAHRNIPTLGSITANF